MWLFLEMEGLLDFVNCGCKRRVGASEVCVRHLKRDSCYFFFQAEDGIRDVAVTGVQTCALPICKPAARHVPVNGQSTAASAVNAEPRLQPRIVATRSPISTVAPSQRFPTVDLGPDRKSVV